MLCKELIKPNMIISLAMILLLATWLQQRPVLSLRLLPNTICPHENMTLNDLIIPQGLLDGIEIAPNCPPPGSGLNSWGAPTILWTIEPITLGADSIYSSPAELMSAEIIANNMLTFQYNLDVKDDLLNTTIEQIGVWIKVQQDQLKTVSVEGDFHQVQILPGFTKFNNINVNGYSNSVRGFVEADNFLLKVGGNGNSITLEESSPTTIGLTLDVDATYSEIDIHGQVHISEVDGENNQIRIQGKIKETLKMLGKGGIVVVNDTETCEQVEFVNEENNENETRCIVEDLAISAEQLMEEGCTIKKEMGLCNVVDNNPSAAAANVLDPGMLAWKQSLGVLFFAPIILCM